MYDTPAYISVADRAFIWLSFLLFQNLVYLHTVVTICRPTTCLNIKDKNCVFYTHVIYICGTCDSHVKEQLISLHGINELGFVIDTQALCSDFTYWNDIFYLNVYEKIAVDKLYRDLAS
jgi:hypothetical protein